LASPLEIVLALALAMLAELVVEKVVAGEFTAFR